MNDISLYEKIPEIENSYPIKIRMYEADTLLPHWHEHLEMLYILDGGANIRCNSESFEVQSGETAKRASLFYLPVTDEIPMYNHKSVLFFVCKI